MADAKKMSLDRLLVWAASALQRGHQRAVAPHGMSATGLGLLDVLAENGGVSHREASGMLGVTPATLTPVVDALERHGAVNRERDPADRRVVRLAITLRGRERLQVAKADVATKFEAHLPAPRPSEEAVIRDYLLAVLAAVPDD